MYTILGILFGSFIGSRIPAYGQTATITKALQTIAGAAIGGGIGFGYGASKLASGTHPIVKLFEKKT